jgi:galactokinase
MQQSLAVMELEVCERFVREFDAGPEGLVTSPGRVNIIGEHTDYNSGLVLPMAINRCLMMAVSKREDNLVRVVTTDFEETVTFRLSDLEKGKFTWGEYITGCMWGLQDRDLDLMGFDMVITGNIPVGASLSSSAALELGVLRAASFCSGFEWDPVAMAKLAQRAENEWVGMNCGLMDQMICACGQRSHAILIDFKDLTLKPYPLPENSSIVILDTTTRRGLIDSAYNERRQQCENAASVMGVATLREADDSLLKQYKERLASLEYLRAKHIISENKRVELAAQAMKNGASQELGELMYQSHISLRDDFDVSGEALNVMVECAMAHPACYGARMTGAGFAGCAVALVAKEAEQEFVQTVADEYGKRMGQEPNIYVCIASDGTTIKRV